MIRVRQLWQEIHSSLWFLPGLIVVAAVGLALAWIQVDDLFGEDLLERWPLLFGAGTDGARQLLATVASSMITVAGVVFSITVVALSLASTQYTSRVLRNFMRDRVNQSVFGIFVGIFAYCLVVLRTIHGDGEEAYVPSVAVLFGLVLAFLGIAVLIYFIHHISSSIQASQILATVSQETLRAVDHLFPDGVGSEAPEEGRAPKDDAAEWHAVPADATGFVQSLDTKGLLDYADERGVVLRMDREVGSFVVEGAPLAYVTGPAPSEKDVEELAGHYAIGRQRTVEQDASFGIRQIVDVALKGLSPGINDTTTAVICVEYVTVVLLRLTSRRIESRFRGRDGEVRLVTRGPTYEGLVEEGLDQIRQHGGGNVAVLNALIGALTALAGAVTLTSRRRVLVHQALALRETVRRTVPAPLELGRLEERLSRLLVALGEQALAGIAPRA